MASESFAWLHLTDFHFGLKGQKFLWPNLRQPFLDDLADLHARCGPWNAVLFTGDLVQQGKSDEFQEMQREVLDRLWIRLRELGSGDAILLAVPGNHDLFRPNAKEDNPAVDALLDKDGFNRVAAKFWDNPASAYRRVVNEALAAYSEWWNASGQRQKTNLVSGILPGDFACTLECAGRRIGIVGLNTTFLQLQGGDYQGKLVWDVRQLHAACGGAVDDWQSRHHVCLLLTHQGPDWLTPEARQHGDREIAPAGRFAVHLFGHMHETKIEYVRKGGSQNATRLCQGCSVFGMEKMGEPPVDRSHGYAAGRIEFKKKYASLRLWPRVTTHGPDGWRFIPDHAHCVLKSDEGTAAEKISLRHVEPKSAASPRKAKPALPKSKVKEQPIATLPFTSHLMPPSHRPSASDGLRALQDHMARGDLRDSFLAPVVLDILVHEQSAELAGDADGSLLVRGIALSDAYCAMVRTSAGTRDWQLDFAQVATPTLVAVARLLARSADAQAALIGLCNAIAGRLRVKIVWPADADEYNDLTNRIYAACLRATELESDDVLMQFKGLVVVGPI